MRDKALADFISSASKHSIPKGETPDYIRKAQGGDKAALDKLVLSNAGLAVKLAAAYFDSGARIGLEPLDIVISALYGPAGDGRTGLVRALMSFDLSRDLKLSTYAHYWIADALRQAIRGDTVRRPNTRRAEPLIRQDMPDDGLDAELRDEPDAEENIDRVEREAAIRAILARLPPRTRIVMARRFGKADATLSDIGAELGISRERVRQIEAQTLEWLRDKFTDDPIILEYLVHGTT